MYYIKHKTALQFFLLEQKQNETSKISRHKLPLTLHISFVKEGTIIRRYVLSCLTA